MYFRSVNRLIEVTELYALLNILSIMVTVAYISDRFSSTIQTSNGNSVSSGSSVRKFTGFIYFYSFCQLLVATKTVDKNPKYFYSLIFDLSGAARWKMLPFGIFECYMSFTLASLLLFYVLLYLSYLKTSRTCVHLLW